MKHAGFLAVLLAIGCTRVDNGSSTAVSGPAKPVDPWPVAAEEFNRTPDIATARRVIHQLNSALDAQNQSLPAMDTDALVAKLHPSDDEVKDWSLKSFSGMDANYLGQCLFFRQVAASLDVDDLPVPERAKAAFDWVCRQMYLRPWILSTPQGQAPMPPIPPQFALRRGYGSGAEREMAFFALARQLGLDPVLVGPPGLETKARFDGSSPRGVFWAVGVRDGDDVILFDPWIGEVMPAKLKAAKATPQLVTAWIESKKSPFTVPPEAVASAVGYFAVPLNAVTPRMKLLEEKTGLKLAVSVPDGPIYSPTVNDDPYSLPHVLGSFTPKDEGGYDAKPLGPNQLAFLVSQIEPQGPAAVLPAPAELTNESARQHFRGSEGMEYKAMLFDSGLRERQQRGQFNEVVRQLGELDRNFARLTENVRAESEALREWYAATNKAYVDLALTNLPENAARRPEAQAQINQVWNPKGPAGVAVRNAIAVLAANDLAYLFALSKHEQAERTQTRFHKSGDGVRAAADWAVAKDAWDRYFANAARFEAHHPGRNAHARKLADRAKTLAANPQERR